MLLMGKQVPIGKINKNAQANRKKEQNKGMKSKGTNLG
jgi:hypothetical protein